MVFVKRAFHTGTHVTALHQEMRTRFEISHVDSTVDTLDQGLEVDEDGNPIDPNSAEAIRRRYRREAERVSVCVCVMESWWCFLT